MPGPADIRRTETTDSKLQPPDRLAWAKRLSHDLRAPLNGIIGFAELIHDGKAGPVTAEQREFLGDIMASARQLLALVHEALDLPKREPTAAEPEPALARHVSKPVPAPSFAPEVGGPTILVVDDEAADRARLVEMLTAAGYAVETATTGAEAIARCHERRFDGVTLDLMLPDMTGWDVVRGIRDSAHNAETPTVVVSLMPHKVAVSGFVVHDVVAKPARAEDLLAALGRASSKSETRRPSRPTTGSPSRALPRSGSPEASTPRASSGRRAPSRRPGEA